MLTQAAQGSSVMALDVGGARVGVAIADWATRLPRPLTTLNTNDSLSANIKALVEAENVTEVVVGLPRNLNGNDTSQTVLARRFAERLRTELGIPVRFQDEALTTKKAVAELSAHRRPRPEMTTDSLAAVYILEDYLRISPAEAGQ